MPEKLTFWKRLRHVQRRYKIDPHRIVLIGFSMGGAGAWHIGAHYADRWIAVAPARDSPKQPAISD